MGLLYPSAGGVYGFADHAGAVPVRGREAYTAGRTVGMLALELMILCFGVSVVVQLYLKDTPSNFVLLAMVCALLVLSADWLFFYYMPGYAGAGERFLWVVLPSALMTAPGSWLLHCAVRRISTEFKIDNGVV